MDEIVRAGKTRCSLPVNVALMAREYQVNNITIITGSKTPDGIRSFSHYFKFLDFDDIPDDLKQFDRRNWS